MAEEDSIRSKAIGQELIEAQEEFSRMPSQKLHPRELRSDELICQAFHPLLRVRNPIQNPKTTPRTIESCSIAKSDPRSSGGLISAM